MVEEQLTYYTEEACVAWIGRAEMDIYLSEVGVL